MRTGWKWKASKNFNGYPIQWSPASLILQQNEASASVSALDTRATIEKKNKIIIKINKYFKVVEESKKIEGLNNTKRIDAAKLCS